MKQATIFKNYALDITHENSTFEVPVIEMHGTPSADTLFIFSALHGDEYEATRAIHLVQDYFKSEQLTGRIIAIPVANPAAYKANLRSTPDAFDGENLARSFPGDANGTLTQKIADSLWNLILNNRTENSFILDLHSGGQNYSYAHLSGIRDLKIESTQTKIAMELARAMQIPNLWMMPATAGTLSTVAIASGIPAIGCEVEGTGGLNPLDVMIYFKGILNVLRYTKQLSSGELFLQEGEFVPIETIYSAVDGFIASCPTVESPIKSGEVICEILDYFGDPKVKIHSPCDGKIWAIRRNPSIAKGEIIALVSHERKQI